MPNDPGYNLPYPSDHPDSRLMQSPPGRRTRIAGEWYLYFAGTSYFGLTGHPEVIEAGCQAQRDFGVHSATSRGGYGNTTLMTSVEEAAADCFGTETALYFLTGYIGNQIAVQALHDRFEVVFLDELAHYCMEEAAQFMHRPTFRFAHRSADDLAEQLRRHLQPGQRPLVMTDGVYASSGAFPDLIAYREILSRYPGSLLMLDDAHGFGTMGERGRGVVDHFGLWNDRVNSLDFQESPTLFVSGTLSKTFGGFGGVIPCSRAFYERTQQTSHFFDGASDPPSAACGSTLKAIEIVRRDPTLRTRLQRNIEQMRNGARQLGIETGDWPTPIVSLRLKDAANMRRIHAGLRHHGILLPYINNYAGVPPQGHLRCAISAEHTEEDIRLLLETLGRLL